MRLAIFAFTREGCALADRIQQAMAASECRKFTMAKFGLPDFEAYTPPLADFTGPVFHWADTVVFVGSTGMAIRAIAPWVTDKKTDPGVIVADEAGNFVISLLSGHIGGANAHARQLAAALGAVPVVTTATDVRGRFSVDTWAAEHGAAISDMKLAKAVSARILEKDIPLRCEFPISGDLPGGIVPGGEGPLGVAIGYHTDAPFADTLYLTPRVLHLGLGCRRGTPAEKIDAAVRTVLEQHHIRREAIAKIASIDLKADEPGLLAFCESWGIPACFYSAEQLMAVPGDFPVSEFVRNITGADNVCQRAALLDADHIIIEKTAIDGVTVAVAVQKWEAVF